MSVRHALPVPVLGLCLGLTGFYVMIVSALKILCDVPGDSVVIQILAAVLPLPCLALILAYLVLGVRSGSIASDFRDDAKRSLLSAGAMALMNVGGVYVQVLDLGFFGQAIYYLGVVAHVSLQPFTLYHLVVNRPALKEYKTVWVVPLVGIELGAQPMCVSDEAQIFFVLLGFSYLLLVTPGIFTAAILRYRKLEGPGELPSLVVLLAPFWLFLAKWLPTSPLFFPTWVSAAVATSVGVLGAVALVIVATQIPRMARLPLTPGSAAYTFPVLTMGATLLRWSKFGFNNVQRDVNPVEVAVCWIVVVLTGLPTLFAIFSYLTLAARGKLFVKLEMPELTTESVATSLRELPSSPVLPI